MIFFQEKILVYGSVCGSFLKIHNQINKSQKLAVSAKVRSQKSAQMLMIILRTRFVYILLTFIIEITFFQIAIFQVKFLNLVYSGFLYLFATIQSEGLWWLSEGATREFWYFETTLLLSYDLFVG